MEAFVAYYMDTNELSIENSFKNLNSCKILEKATMCRIVVELKMCLCVADRIKEIEVVTFTLHELQHFIFYFSV